MQPTVNVTIDEPAAAPRKPFPPPPPDTAELFKLVGASFGIGVLVGGMLVLAFSKCPAE